MDLPRNAFKNEIADGAIKHGIFVSLADRTAAEIAAAAGFEWLIIDGEHAPNDLRTILDQLQATNGYPVAVGVRVYEGDQALIKRVLDLGVLTLMVPMVETAQQAAEIVSYTRYPPEGIRGVASGRAARWTLVPDYHAQANDQICVIAQIESAAGLANIDSIAAVDGIDMIFIGPSDLGASLGHLGNAGHPEVQAAVIGAIEAAVAAGVPAGVFAASREAAQRYRQAGATCLLVGVDAYVLAKSLAALAADFTAR